MMSGQTSVQLFQKTIPNLTLTVALMPNLFKSNINKLLNITSFKLFVVAQKWPQNNQITQVTV